MLKREWGVESNGKLPHLSIPSKSAAWVPEFAVEDLPLSRSTALVPEFAVKDLPLGRILMTMMMYNINVLPKGSCFTANSGTNAGVLPKGRFSTVISGIRLIYTVYTYIVYIYLFSRDVVYMECVL